jgi:hypothetical protein
VSGIFISYRHGDTAAWAGRLSDTLKNSLGRISVFRDIEDIPPGVEFETFIGEQVGSCRALIALIGPNWLTATDDAGRRRLDDAKDFVRTEIASALTRNVPVVPVLVAGAQMPRAEDLPEVLKPLSRRQAFTLTDTHWPADCKRLASIIEKHLPMARRLKIVRLAAAGAVVVILAGAGFKLLRPSAKIAVEDAGKSNRSGPLPLQLASAWPNGHVITVSFLNGSLAQQQKVEQVAPEWTRFANLKFRFVEVGKDEVRVKFASEIAGWSFRGTEALDIPAKCPTMMLVGISGDNNSISEIERASILHEFGHVLGFLDEIQNPNGHIPWRPEIRQHAADYVYAQSVSECRAPLNQPVTHTEQIDNYKDFDPRSIMMAQVGPQYLTENISLGAAGNLTDGDRAFAAKLYPREGADPQTSQESHTQQTQ